MAVVAAWDRLPERVQGGIVAMVWGAVVWTASTLCDTKSLMGGYYLDRRDFSEGRDKNERDILPR